jgi:(2S)-methylsuccinyl-CoA dehydrogenase
MPETVTPNTISAARVVALLHSRIETVSGLVDGAFAHLHATCWRNGKPHAASLDAAQVASYELAVCAGELTAARAVQEYAERARAADPLAGTLADLFTMEVLSNVVGRLAARPGDFGLPIGAIVAAHPAQEPLLVSLQEGAHLAAAGAALVAREGRLPLALLEADKELMRETFREFGAEIVAPLAQSIHRGDSDIPEQIIAGAAELGLFGVSIPERFGGLQPDDAADTLAMLVVTEALSAASLGGAGSLITRPEIMARSLLAGGTPEQQSRWLPAIAAGEKLVAIAITEPDFGSDVASLRLRATRTEGGWLLSGSKTWCTFAGRANLILLIGRTNPDPAAGHRGLSQFVVEKPAFPGHDFTCESPRGGKLTGRAIPTIGYRGMHSFDLFFEDFFVPADALVGGAKGEGRGFYLAMAGLTGGRVQTAARANGVMQSAFDAGLRYAQGRRVFGQPIADYALTQARLARMAAWLTASRQLSYAVARRMDAGGGEMEASLVKLFACRAAEWVTRDAMQMHGGMGYAEETDASRYFIDARVLSIFEGAEETLALKVIARELIAKAGEAAAAGKAPQAAAG